MAVVSNPLLQLSATSTSPVTSVSSSSKVLDDSNDKASAFAELYAKHSEQQQAKSDLASRTVNSKVAQAPKDVPAAKDKGVADKSNVADSGKALPAKADKSARADNNDKADASAKSDAADKAQSKNASDKVAQADTGDDNDDDDDDSDDDSASLNLDAAPAPQTADAAPITDLTAPSPVVDATPVQPALDPSVVASMVPPAPAPVVTPTTAATSKTDVDPAPDALADLPAVRLALEQSAKAQGTTSAHASKGDENNASQATGGDPTLVNGLAAQLTQQQSSDAAGHSNEGDKAFAAIIDDGLKDIKGASSDTRMDNFANRLQSLTDAATAKTSSATPVSTPLAMNQSGWTEGVVNRVMYLSSQNLKSADIELSPAELGKLNITVNMAPDQQTQVTFISAHVGVREALENQQSRLKEMFAQQGLGQMDVNVSDQSRNSQGQQQQAQEASRLASSSRSGASDGGVDDSDASVGAAAAVSQSVVIGSSAVDYYA